MNRRTFLLGLTAVASIPVDRVLARPDSAGAEYEAMQISVGANGPSLDLWSDHLMDILVGLHQREPLSALGGRLGITDGQLRERVGKLIDEGLVRRNKRGDFVPTCLVVTLEDAQRYLVADRSVVERTATLIESRVPDLKSEYRTLTGFRNTSFSQSSLLMLSDVLLDNWQIDGVETDFLHALRPLRKGGRYYLAIVEHHKNEAVEPLGIYGNHADDEGSISINLYGNERYNGPTNLINLTASDAVTIFGFDKNVPLSVVRRELADDIVKLWNNPATAIKGHKLNGLHRLGWLMRTTTSQRPCFHTKTTTGLGLSRRG